MVDTEPMRAMNWAEAFQPKQEIVKANLSGHKEHASFDPGAITNTVRMFMGMNIPGSHSRISINHQRKPSREVILLKRTFFDF
jgi:hypothetical protein